MVNAAVWLIAGSRRATNMSVRFAAAQLTRGAIAIFAFLMIFAFLIMSPALPQDAPPAVDQARPNPMPSGQKSGVPGGRANPPPSPAVAEQHRLPADSTTKQTLSLPGRTLAFT